MTASTSPIQSLDLTREFPRSPGTSLGLFNILPRVIDKCRALICGVNGAYNYNCPLDEIFFSFTGIDADEFKAFVALGSSDADILRWVEDRTQHLTQEQILAWGYENRVARPEDDEEKAYYEQQRLSHSPDKLHITTWFELLDAEEGRI
jgi:hypothetical protein